MSSSRSPGQRAGLTRAGIVACARDLVAERGREGVTMRSLAHRLGVAPNALYSHVPNKTALIDAVLDDVLAEVEAPADTRDPVEALYALMRATLDVLQKHPGLVPLYLDRHGARGPNAQRLGAVMLELLKAAGVADADAGAAQRVLIVSTIGMAAFGSRLPFEPDRPVPPSELTQSFDQALRWLLAGITQAAP